MLGHMVSLYLKEQGYNVYGLAKHYSSIVKTLICDALNFNDLKIIITREHWDCIINCIGILNKSCDEDPCNAILLNSYLPHFLVDITKDTDTKIIHISTDCVFSGNKGSYKVDGSKDAQSLYGISKSLGEICDNKNVTIRTSIIGPDLNKNGIGLFNWFIHQDGEVNGFSNVYWTGLTTLECAKVIETVIESNLSGLYNVAPQNKISKYELLMLLKKYFKPDINVKSVENPKNDKSLISNFVYIIPEYDDMIRDLSKYIKEHNIWTI